MNFCFYGSKLLSEYINVVIMIVPLDNAKDLY